MTNGPADTLRRPFDIQKYLYWIYKPHKLCGFAVIAIKLVVDNCGSQWGEVVYNVLVVGDSGIL